MKNKLKSIIFMIFLKDSGLTFSDFALQKIPPNLGLFAIFIVTKVVLS